MTSLRSQQACIFLIGWCAYASTYFLRKPLGVIKSDLENEGGYSKAKLGLLDTALLLPYAVMQILLGQIGDKWGVRRTFGLCLILSSFSMVTFGLWDNFNMYFLLLFINGTAQSQCWPNCSKALISWYSSSVRNSVFGMFGTCAFAGGIMGTLLAVYLQTSYGWRYCFALPSIFVGVMGVIVLLFYKTSEEAGASIPGQETSQSKQESPGSDKAPSLLQLVAIPAVPEVAVSMFCLKMVRYCMYMWLPMYLHQHLNYTKAMAGVCSTTFEIGGVIGSALLGIVLDRYFPGRSLTGTSISIFLSTASLVLFFITSTSGMVVNSICMFFAGAFNAGPDTILGGAVPLDLGERNNKKAGAATVGLVNGFGSVGTCVEGPIIGLVSSVYGWSGMFYMMITLSGIGVFTNLRAARIFNNALSSPSSEPIV